MRNKVLIGLSVVAIVVLSVAVVKVWDKNKVQIKAAAQRTVDHYNAEKQAADKNVTDLKQARADNLELCYFVRDQLVANKFVKVVLPQKCVAVINTQQCATSGKPITGDCSEFNQ